MSVFSIFKPKLEWSYCLYLFAMVAGWPMVFSFMGWLPEWKLNYMVLGVVSVLTMILSKSEKLPSPISKLIYVQLLSFVLYSVLYMDSSYITRVVYLVTTYALLSIQMARPKTEFIDTNISLLTIQVIMGSIGFVLFWMNLLPVISTFKEFDGHTGEFYGLFTTTVSKDGLLRVSGFFDEPGAFAFWGIVALLYNKLFVNNKKIELILIVGLICTLSMAYFIQIIIYVILFYKKRLSKVIVYGLLLLILLIIVASLSPEVNHAIFGRFHIDVQTGRLEGDNRTEHAMVCLEIWRHSPFFGVGAKELISISKQMKEFVGANPFTFFASDGLIGQIILWLPLFYLFFMGKYNPKYRYAAIVLFIGFLQRPYDPTQLWYDITMYMMILEAYRETYMYGDVGRSNIADGNFIPVT